MIAFRSMITGCDTIRIGIFFFTNVQRLLSKFIRIMCFVQNRFPEKQRGMISMYADHIANIRVNTFTKNRLIVPKLPSGNFYQSEKPQFVTSIHKSRINHIMSTDHLQPGITQFFGISPLHGIR